MSRRFWRLKADSFLSITDGATDPPSLSSLGVTLVFASVNTAVIILRRTKPDLKRPFKVASIGRFRVTAALGVASSLLLAAQYEWKVYLTFLIAILAGAIPYALARCRSSPEPLNTQRRKGRPWPRSEPYFRSHVRVSCAKTASLAPWLADRRRMAQPAISIAILRKGDGWRVISDGGSVGGYAYRVDAEEAALRFAAAAGGSGGPVETRQLRSLVLCVNAPGSRQ